MDDFIKRAIRVRRVATKEADREITRRCAAKARAYLSGLEIVSVLGIAGERTPHEMALSLADSHNFNRKGSDRTWSGKVGGNDYPDRKRQTAVRAIGKADSLVDKSIKAKETAARLARKPASSWRPKAPKAQRIQVYRG